MAANNEVLVVRPTWEEFKDFYTFVTMLEDIPKVSRDGIVKIIPPPEWVPRKTDWRDPKTMKITIEEPLLQVFKKGNEKGSFYMKSSGKKPMTIQQYADLAESKDFAPPEGKDHKDLEKLFWSTLNGTKAIYACDMDRRLINPKLKEWNLGKLKCILDLIKIDKRVKEKGILTPFTFIGMFKTGFSWHVEDYDLCAINVIYYGKPKTWYCIPPRFGYKLEELVKRLFPEWDSGCSNFLRHKMSFVSPELLKKNGIPFTTTVQEEMEIIVTFPYAYHQGFNHGFNIAEATNFGTEKWVEYGKRSRVCDCYIIESKVPFCMDVFVFKYQNDRYWYWINQLDIAPHPNDPEEKAALIRLKKTDPKLYAVTMAQILGAGSLVSCTEEESGRDQDGRKFQVYELYQHDTLKNVKVTYDPEANIVKKGLEKMRYHCELSDLEMLANRGTMIKMQRIKRYTGRPKKIENEATAGVKRSIRHVRGKNKTKNAKKARKN